MRHVSRVKFWLPDKNWGFLEPHESGGKDVFVHISEVNKAGFHKLDEGQIIAYDLAMKDKGPCALRISLGNCPACHGTGFVNGEGRNGSANDSAS